MLSEEIKLWMGGEWVIIKNVDDDDLECILEAIKAEWMIKEEYYTKWEQEFWNGIEEGIK